MTREEKQQTIEELKEEFVDANSFYLTDASTLTVEQINGFRRQCFEKGIRFRVAKNTLIRKALEEIDSERYADLYELLTGPTSIMISEVSNSLRQPFAPVQQRSFSDNLCSRHRAHHIVRAVLPLLRPKLILQGG